MDVELIVCFSMTDEGTDGGETEEKTD